MRVWLSAILAFGAGIWAASIAQASDFAPKSPIAAGDDSAGDAGAWLSDMQYAQGLEPTRWRIGPRLGGRYSLDLSSNARLDMPDQGDSVEAMAMAMAMAMATVRFGKNLEQRVSEALGGVRDGASFRDQGRWYIYAAASGKAVGLNMLRGQDGWSRAGWSSDPAARVIAGAQAGVAWRKGPMQAAFGYLQRRAKVRKEVEGVDTRADSMVAFSFSLTPRW